MERQTTDPFLTTPNLKIQEVTEFDQNLPQSLKQKIINILKAFNEKQLLNQAITNLGIPRNLVDADYILSRPQQQMSKLHTMACAIRKQVQRIKRASTVPQQQKFSSIQSPKTTQSNTARQLQGIWQRKPLLYIKKQLSPQMRMKQAIQRQLQYRQKLQARSNKISTVQKARSQFLSKRRQNAKLMNKKVSEFYQKYKENQQLEFEKAFTRIIQSFNNQGEEDGYWKRASSQMGRRDEGYMVVKERFERANLKFQEYLQRQVFMRLQRDKSLEKFKDRQMNLLNQKIHSHKTKSQQVLQRKIISSIQQQTRKLNDFIHKQLKYSQNKKPAATDKDTRLSQSSRSHIRNNFRTSFPMHQTRSIDVDKENEKENMIKEKLMRKSELKEGLMREKVARIKRMHKMNEEKRQISKESQMKFITETVPPGNNINNDSFLYPRSQLRSKDTISSQQCHIKKNHLNALKTIECQQTMNKLRKLPKSQLMKHINKIKFETETDCKEHSAAH